EIPQIRPQGGGWAFGSIPAPRPLYRLKELVSAPANKPVLIFEGEQKADLAAKLGFVATTCSQGAGNAKLTDFSPLNNRPVYLFPDNDEPGREHMHDVARRAGEANAACVRIVALPNLPEKGDIVDYHRAREQAGLDDGAITEELRAALKAASEANIDPTDSDDALDGGSDDCSIADRIVALASVATFFHDESGEPFATIEVDGHCETWHVASERFARWLASIYYRSHAKAVPPASMTTAIGQLKAIAQFDGEQRPVYKRVAQVEGDIWVDLCDDEWRAVKVTRSGWSVVDAPPVCFVRKSGMKSLPAPKHGLGNFDRLFDLLHFHDADLRLLVTAWIVNTLVPSSSYPILAVTGEQGSGKTTFSRALQRLVDPHEMEGRSPPRSEEDIAVAAQHAHVLTYENLSGVSANLSDSLCRVATGAAFAARKLYPDCDERQLRFCQPIIVNGIDDLATRSDLADRMICVQLAQIQKGQRQTESDLWTAFEAIAHELLGAALDLVSGVLAADDVNVPLERMADYSTIGAKVAKTLGLEAPAFSDAYRANRDLASQAALETSAIGPVILRLVRTTTFNGLMGGLLRQLQSIADQHEQRHPEWPNTPRKLGNELRRLSPNFTRVGVQVEFLGHRRDGHWVRIEEVSADNGHNSHISHEGA
ncbi:MAG: hypothetical protein KAI24_15325, partial [Planctomycetes bacterium]|nr:hypothetical protein [Planctomycetota bacterium]